MGINTDTYAGIQKLYLFLDNYKIVKDLIFGEVEDTAVQEFGKFDEKMMKVDGLSAIYRLYVGSEQTLGSLSSTVGVALNFHMAYYLSGLPASKRMETINLLL